jgi:A/G-specific adenine glycosylase
VVTSPSPAAPDWEQVVHALLKWFAGSARDLPWRRTTDPYAIWISEVMLQQTQVRTVIPYWDRWMRELPTIGSLASAPAETVLKLWEGLGYYSRARNLQKAAVQMQTTAEGRFPTAHEAILELPGIGPYTAGAIASIAYNQPTPILDGNIIRVLTRLEGLAGDPKSTPVQSALWSRSAELVARASELPRRRTPLPPPPIQLSGACSALNQSLMELGATHCTPTHPNCTACPISRECRAFAMGTPQAFPQTAPRPTTISRHLATLLWEYKGRWLLLRRPENGINEGLWEFPNIECGSAESAPDAAARWVSIPSARLTPLGKVTNAITRFRYTQHLFKVSGAPDNAKLPASSEWVPLPTLAQIPMSGSHRRIAKRHLPTGT